MTARPLLIAGMLLFPLMATSHVAAHSLPTGPAINAVDRARNADASTPGVTRMAKSERSQGAPASRPARKKHPASRSQDND
jgi:hypothetical protein